MQGRTSFTSLLGLQALLHAGHVLLLRGHHPHGGGLGIEGLNGLDIRLPSQLGRSRNSPSLLLCLLTAAIQGSHYYYVCGVAGLQAGHWENSSHFQTQAGEEGESVWLACQIRTLVGK